MFISLHVSAKELNMSHVDLINPADATGAQKEILDQVSKAFGTVPNLFKAIANSPAALESMFGSFQALGKGKLGSKLGEQIAVAIANVNSCEYCLSAHTALGIAAGLSESAMAEAQAGRSEDPRTQAALDFALKLVKEHGQVNAEDVEALRNAGFSDEEIVEIVAHVALNIFTNYTNVALDVPLDFPKVELRRTS
jgi:uncharacterized peroxidase-related enzyme